MQSIANTAQPLKKLDLIHDLAVFFLRIIGLTGTLTGGIRRVPDGACVGLSSKFSYHLADCDFMFIVGNFLRGLAKVLDLGLGIYFWIIIARAVLSWVNPDPYNPIVRFIHAVTEPVLVRIRSRLPLLFGGFDFSPLLILAAILFLQEFLIKTLYQLGGS